MITNLDAGTLLQGALGQSLAKQDGPLQFHDEVPRPLPLHRLRRAIPRHHDLAAGRQLDVVDMVHPEFEDAFDVYSTNKVEARTLIHPSYVERLIAIENALATSKLRAMFCDGTITVMLWLQNMFESGRLDARKDREKVEQTIRQFRSLADLAIDLNRR